MEALNDSSVAVGTESWTYWAYLGQWLYYMPTMQAQTDPTSVATYTDSGAVITAGPVEGKLGTWATGITSLGMPPSYLQISPQKVNNAGTVFGSYVLFDAQGTPGPSRTAAFSGSAPLVANLGTDSSGHSYGIEAVNDQNSVLSSGVIINDRTAGTNYLATVTSLPNFAPPVVFTNANSDASPWGTNLNNSLQVAHGKLWQNAHDYDLTTLIAPNSGFTGVNALMANNNGAIVGTATYSGTNTAIAQGSHGVMLVPFPINASIQNGTITITVPDLDFGTAGTLDVIFMNSKTSTQVIVSTKQNQAPGQITLNLDDIITGSQNTPLKPLDNQDASIFDGVCCRWRVGSLDITTGETPFDVNSVEVLAKRIISNYFSPKWTGTWNGSTYQKGVYPASQFPGGLYNATVKGEFLDALDPGNEGLAMNGNTVIRDRYQPAQTGYNQVTADTGNTIPNESDSQTYAAGYICFPDVDQRNTATGSTVALLRATSVAVRSDGDRLSYKTGDKVYIPQYKVRTVDDSGTLHGNQNQIDVWLGQGDDSLEQQANAYGVVSGVTCLKILTQ